MAIISEKCRCGAKFEVSGREAFCAWRYSDFLKAHEICRHSKDEGSQASRQSKEASESK